MHSSFQQLQFHLASPASSYETSNNDNYDDNYDDNDDDNNDDNNDDNDVDDDDELVISVVLEGEKSPTRFSLMGMTSSGTPLWTP
ncbi:hypothetical protein M0802_009750 [Mischocyttarus mexicanus]|nr:hypothetical protein M0802_009750 [Mischocyttarus mexicanus]